MTFVDFSQLKLLVPIERVLDRYGLTPGMKRLGADLRGPCPVHQGSNPTQFSVDPDKNCWRCFTCEAGGTIIDLVAALEGVDLHEAGVRIAGWFGAEAATAPRAAHAGTSSPGPAWRRPAQAPSPPLGFRLTLDPSHPYLAERRLAPETVAAFGLGYCARGMLAGRIAVPIHDGDGRLVAYAGRWPGEPPPEVAKYLLPPSFAKSLVLFNLHRVLAATADGPLIVVEGFFDCMRLWQAGYPRTVALMGTSLSDAQAARILAMAGPAGRVLLAFDEDDAGRKAREAALARFSRAAYVRVLELGGDGLDPGAIPAAELRSLIEGGPA
jgi:DNA primase